MNGNVRTYTTTALMAAVICVLGPLSIPVGPVPVSLSTLAVYLTMYLLDTKRGVMAVGIYILMGFVGLPVFAGFTAGAGKLLGPTGGYILGYIPMAFLIGLSLERLGYRVVPSIIAMELSTWVLYLSGTLWLSFQSGMGFSAALYAGVIPFIPVDICKIVVAAVIGARLRSRLVYLTGAGRR